MARTALEGLLAAMPLPVLVIDRTERIISANAEALTLVGQSAQGTHYVTILRQPVLIDAIEATLGDGQPRTTRYLGNDGVQDTTYQVSCRAIPDMGAGAATVTAK